MSIRFTRAIFHQELYYIEMTVETGSSQRSGIGLRGRIYIRPFVNEELDDLIVTSSSGAPQRRRSFDGFASEYHCNKRKTTAIYFLGLRLSFSLWTRPLTKKRFSVPPIVGRMSIFVFAEDRDWKRR